jgi:hypothetical protein
MRDAINNAIKEGDLLTWDLSTMMKQGGSSIIVRAQRVHDGGLSLAATGDTTPPVLTVLIDIPISGVKPGSEAHLSDFLCVRDPRSEQLLDKLTGGKAS